MIATDAWHPQVNGVVRTLDSVTSELRKLGHEVKVLSHEGKRTFSLPSYKEIQLAFYSQKEIQAIIEEFDPESIHIATEGPIGWAVRKYCLKNKLAFTTGFHTRFAEYVEARLPIPGVKRMAYAMLRNFHKPSAAVLTPTKTVSRELEERGFKNVKTWTRGVDHDTFKPYPDTPPADLKKPVMVYVGRLEVEKGIEDFLDLKNPGTKLVIGDGPSRETLQRKYPEIVFTGYLFGEELARRISTGDVFVFPSKTDTFGLVMIEAMACGLPVAAYPVMGPIDVVEHGHSGFLDDDLEKAVNGALKLKREDAIAYARTFTWKNTALKLLENFVPVKSENQDGTMQATTPNSVQHS